MDRANADEHVVIFMRPKRERREGREEIADKVVKGDRMILSLEVDRRRVNRVGSAGTSDLPVGQSAPNGVCGDIEDLGSGASYSSSGSGNGSGLIEPNIATGQVVKVTRSEVHVSLRQRPRRLIRYCAAAVPYVRYISVCENMT